MALCAKADIKTFLTIPTADTNRDTLIESLILAVQDVIEKYCNRVFEQASVTEYHHGGSDKIFVRRPPIATSPAPQIWEDPDRDFDSATLLEADDFFVGEGPDDGTIFSFYEFEEGPGAIKITYTGGYSTIPSAIKQACVELVAKRLKTPGNIGIISQGTPGGINTTFSEKDIPTETKLNLDLYRLELSQ